MIINNAELWFIRLDPTKPNNKFNKENPTWEVQVRTASKEVKKEWEKNGLQLRAVVPDDGDIYFRTNLRKSQFKADGTKAEPVSVVDGDLQPLDPNIIGDGSVGNIRVYQYTYEINKIPTVANILMAVQITKLKKKEPYIREDFKKEEMEIIEDIKEALNM